MPHTATLTTTTTYITGGEQSPRDAYDSRRRRLHDAGTTHTADPHTLTLTWDEERHGSIGAHVSITYS